MVLAPARTETVAVRLLPAGVVLMISGSGTTSRTRHTHRILLLL